MTMVRGSFRVFTGARPLGELVESLKTVGIFLAPVGELEGWLAAEGVEPPKANKAAWANAAALRIQSIGPTKGDIWDFVREVGCYIQQSKAQDLDEGKGQPPFSRR